MGYCEDPSYSCGDTKDAITAWWGSTAITQTKDRVLTFKSGGVSIPINVRTRTYTYSDRYDVQLNDFRYLETGSGQVECYTRKNPDPSNGKISEDYTTVDVNFLYADLRSDLFVYRKSTRTMKFSQAVSFRVHLRTAYDDALRYPFILEDVPITITNEIFCTAFPAPLHTETINSGYWDGVRVLMPGWSAGSEPYGRFTINGTEYDAANVDWYLPPIHEEADGDSFFWWADWLKAASVNNEIDAKDAADLYSTSHGVDYTQPKPVSNGVVTNDFMGSVAVDKANNQFFSASFDTQDGKFKLSKVVVGGVETPLPQEKIQVEQPDGTFKEEDSQHDIYYPVAPL